MAAQQVPLTTLREYLEREKDAKEKSEYVAGEIRAMVGGSSRHNRIKADILGALYVRLLDHETCEPFDSDQKVRLSTAGPYYYPDVTVACDEYFDDDDCLINPIEELEGMDKILQLPSLGVEIPLAALYRRAEL